VKINGMLHVYFGRKRGLRQGEPMFSLVFVLVTEYLTRTMKIFVTQDGFIFHPSCHKLKVCSLMLADDLLLFYKAGMTSVKCMMTAFAHFPEREN